MIFLGSEIRRQIMIRGIPEIREIQGDLNTDLNKCIEGFIGVPLFSETKDELTAKLHEILRSYEISDYDISITELDGSYHVEISDYEISSNLENLVQSGNSDNSDNHNLRIYEDYVKSYVTNQDDLKFVCNQLGNLYQSLNDNNIDNLRVSTFVNGEYSLEYQDLRDSGCCGEVDKIITNPKTMNSFSIGFNFGH